jgi:hypothetical protein
MFRNFNHGNFCTYFFTISLDGEYSTVMDAALKKELKKAYSINNGGHDSSCEWICFHRLTKKVKQGF